LLLAFALCACPPPQTCPDELVIVVDAEVCAQPCTVDFGEVTIALQEQRRVSFQDVTAACGFIEFFLDDDAGGAFILTPGFSPPFAQVQFTPDAAATFEGRLGFSGDIGNGDFIEDEIVLRGTGVTP
jgi:hypothetical protein